MKQNPLQFENIEPLARSRDHETSHLAAEELSDSGVRDAQKRLVLEAVKQYPGLTSRELASAAGLDRYLVARRLPDLREDGFVENPPTDRNCQLSGKLCMTWNTTTKKGTNG